MARADGWMLKYVGYRVYLWPGDAVMNQPFFLQM